MKTTGVCAVNSLEKAGRRQRQHHLTSGLREGSNAGGGESMSVDLLWSPCLKVLWSVKLVVGNVLCCVLCRELQHEN